jgi:hypothetical protein
LRLGHGGAEVVKFFDNGADFSTNRRGKSPFAPKQGQFFDFGTDFAYQQ